ncbi:hypothetical protein [Ruegeria profundi]|nr:hypothetical protein [Ruegeria profundi]
MVIDINARARVIGKKPGTRRDKKGVCASDLSRGDGVQGWQLLRLCPGCGATADAFSDLDVFRTVSITLIHMQEKRIITSNFDRCIVAVASLCFILNAYDTDF